MLEKEELLGCRFAYKNGQQKKVIKYHLRRLYPHLKFEKHKAGSGTKYLVAVVDFFAVTVSDKELSCIDVYVNVDFLIKREDEEIKKMLETIVNDNLLDSICNPKPTEKEQGNKDPLFEKFKRQTENPYCNPFESIFNQKPIGKNPFTSTGFKFPNQWFLVSTESQAKKWISDNTLKNREGGFFAANKELKEDSIVNSVCEDLKSRSKVGVEKYGTTLDRSDLTHNDWVQHAYEESLDLSNYLKKLISEIDGEYSFRKTVEQILSQTNMPLEVLIEDKLAALVEFWNTQAMAKTTTKQ